MLKRKLDFKKLNLNLIILLFLILVLLFIIISIFSINHNISKINNTISNQTKPVLLKNKEITSINNDLNNTLYLSSNYADANSSNININFKIYDLNLINSKINIFLKDNNNLYSIYSNITLDNTHCILNNTYYNCKYSFNIKNLNKKYNFKFKTYKLFVEFVNSNFSLNTNLIINLSNYANLKEVDINSLEINDLNITKNNIDNYIDNLLVIKKAYLLNKSKFNNNLLDYPKIDFEINKSKFQDLNNFKYNYLKIIKEYDSLPKLTVVNRKKIINFKDYNIGNYVFKDINNINKYVSKLIIKNNNDTYSYLFINLKLNKTDSNSIYIDLINKSLLINHTPIDKINNNYIVFSKDVNYLIPYSEDILNNLSKPLLVTQIKHKQKETQNKEPINFLTILFFIIILIIAIINFMYTYDSKLINKYYSKKKSVYLKKKISNCYKKIVDFYKKLKKMIIKQ